MRKVILLTLTCIMLAACGGSSSNSGLANDAEAAKNGFLGSEGETIVSKMAEFDKRAEQLKTDRQNLDKEVDEFIEEHKNASRDEAEKLNREMNEKFNSRTEELQQKQKALDEEMLAWQHSMDEQLKTVQIPTEVSEGSTLKVVEPFNVSSFNASHHTLTVCATVELTVDRPRIKDEMSSNNKIHPTVSAIDSKGNTFAELVVLNSKFDEKYLDLKAGDKIKIMYNLDFSMLGAKKLLIEWDSSADAGQAAATSNTKNELGIFQLRGPVKECIWNDGNETRTIGFDEKGMWTSLNGKTPWGGDMKVKRDSNNRIIKRGDAYDEEYTTYKYNAQGQITEQTDIYMDGGCTIQYTYNSDGDCTSTISSDPEGDVKTTYTILERDANKNWTKRKDNNGNIETRKIYYY